MNQYIMQTHQMILNGEKLLASVKFLLIYNATAKFWPFKLFILHSNPLFLYIYM